MICPRCEEGDVEKYYVLDWGYYMCLSNTCGWLMDKEEYDNIVREALEEVLEEV